MALAATAALLAGGAAAQSNDWRTVAPENLWVIDTAKGRVLVELEPRAAPNHIERIRTLTNQGFYDGLKFHRVIPDFMAQTGDPQGTGAGGSELPDLKGEFTFRRGRDSGFAPVENSGPGLRGIMGSIPVVTQPDAQMFVTADFKTSAQGLFCPGVAGMARAGSPDSANSQFFLMMGQNDNLNGGYTVFGRVVQGMDVVRALKAGNEAQDGAVGPDADVMTRARLASAMPEAERPTIRVAVPGSAPFNAAVEATRAEKGASFNICDVQPPVQGG
ncbi:MULTISPECIES: peptidylprolyl isomerase [Brevundimonas]|uniref:peptidylprolyl isomerase n=1 Tax=Brevundimonas TaxID=41275 RepID=UPI001906D77D|nr:peptidylprolyl isomerase [Brevundimonas diminuta]MBK1977104.1 peptidylprolyl isomerase [Brevundimonas diminuta]MDA0744011.1 peptidylprolyl isomerase [Pseudomonadota bacterium]MDA1321169.1 peptidylprolyl isomerase [Pseudomonadota bacterium]